MDIIQMYSYYDKKSKAYDVPFFSKNEIQAKRKFYLDKTANNGESVIGQFTKDFNLVYVGDYNLKKGEVHPKEKVVVMTGTEFEEVKLITGKE